MKKQFFKFVISFSFLIFGSLGGKGQATIVSLPVRDGETVVVCRGANLSLNFSLSGVQADQVIFSPRENSIKKKYPGKLFTAFPVQGFVGIVLPNVDTSFIVDLLLLRGGSFVTPPTGFIWDSIYVKVSSPLRNLLDQPSVCEGTTVHLQALDSAYVIGPSYQWQTVVDGLWQNIADGNGIIRSQTPYLQILINPTHSNQQFRCIVNFGSCSDTTNAMSIGLVNTRPTVALATPNPSYCGTGVQYQFTGTNSSWNYQIRSSSGVLLFDQSGNGGALTTTPITPDVTNRGYVKDMVTGCTSRY